MKRCFRFGVMAFAALCATAAEYDVTRYGARPDGKSDNTAAIQKAINDCSAKGGGRVLVPGGGTYVTYTLNLKNDVELHIDRGATLLGGYSSLLIQVRQAKLGRTNSGRSYIVKKSTYD